MTICKRYSIEGLVQGVFYRAHTQKRAQALGVRGWVRNELDGSVTVYACGTVDAITELENWLWIGPPSARVENITIAEAEWEECQTFVVR